MIALLLTAALAQQPPQNGAGSASSNPNAPMNQGSPSGGPQGQAAAPGGQGFAGGGQAGGQPGSQGGQPGSQGGQPGSQGGQPGGQGGQPGGQGGAQGGQGGQGGAPGGQAGGQGGQTGGQDGGASSSDPDGMAKYGQPFILRVKDPLKLLDAEPAARLGTGAEAIDVPLKDDGVSPDIAADDQTWTGLVDLYPATSNLILLVAGEEEVLSFDFKIEENTRDPAVEVTLKEGGGTVASLVGKGNNIDAVVSVSEMRSPHQRSAMPGGGGGGQGFSGMENGASVALLSMGVFLAGALLGGGLAWVRLRAGPAGRVSALGPGPSRTGDPGNPSGRGPAQIWVSPRADGGLTSAAARWATQWGPVLLLPDPARRAELTRLGDNNPHIYALPDDQPEPAEAFTAQSALRGDAAIIADGLASLVPPGPTETSTAPAEELCAGGHVILVVGPDDPIPAGVPVYRFVEADGGFLVDGGTLVLD